MTSSAVRRGVSVSVRRSTVLAGAALLVGAVVGVVAGQLHPHREPLNDHAAVFTEYASSTDWVWVHDLQFAAALLVVSGFVLLYGAIAGHGTIAALERCALGAAVATAAVFAVNMAVDGVALRQSVDAWVAAPAAEKPGRFAAAEAVRWLEWGANAFFQILLGLTIALFGVAIARSSIVTRPLGWIGLLAGAGLVFGGLLTGRDGFAGSPVQQIAQLLFVILAIGIIISGVRRRLGASNAPPAGGRADV
ncbi:MAG TPA: DUF4386 family protein [Propionibacteriaceae bacterium]|nr:DUF4386 family protein [Propionibacteriaceae bacterium]